MAWRSSRTWPRTQGKHRSRPAVLGWWRELAVAGRGRRGVVAQEGAGSHPPVEVPQNGLEVPGPLLADLLADGVFLLVQNLLLRLRNVTTILTRHITLFLANLAVFIV